MLPLLLIIPVDPALSNTPSWVPEIDPLFVSVPPVAVFARPIVPPEIMPVLVREIFQSAPPPCSGPVWEAEMVPDVLSGKVCACAATKDSAETPVSNKRRHVRASRPTKKPPIFNILRID